MTAMSEWHRAADLDQVPDGEPFPIEAGGSAVCLYRIGEAIHAVSDICPHQRNVRLSTGYFEDGVIECPMHQSRFDVRTGAVLAPPARKNLDVYEVRIEEGAVFVRRPDAATA
jgi:nitrite reductase/ring-hydroxylating ferredoxin subunit